MIMQAQNSRSSSSSQRDKLINACTLSFNEILNESFKKLDKCQLTLEHDGTNRYSSINGKF